MISFSKSEFSRFLKYCLVGISTFLIDIALLYVFVEWAGIDYRLGAGLAFLIAVSINYFFSRAHVFVGTSRPLTSGYALFISLAMIGALCTALATWAFVSFFGMYYMVSRVLVGAILGFGTYTLNASFIFNVRAGAK